MLPVLVLTAGLGTRLDPLTRLVAKPAVPVAGRTLIERVLEWLQRQGTREVVLNLHHRPETITSVVGDGAHLGLHARYSWEQPILGSAGGPRRALPFLPETFVIANGDTLCEMDLRAMIAAHEHSGASVTLAVVPNRSPKRYSGILADDRNRVQGFVPKGEAAGTWHFVGIQVVSAAIFKPLVDGAPAETVAGIYRDRVASGQRDIHVHPVEAPFIDVGTPRDYLDAALHHAAARAGFQRERSGVYHAEARADFERERRRANVIEGPSPRVHESATVRRSVIWAGSSVGPDANLDECVVAGVHLPAAFTARRAVLVPASLVHAGESVEIIGDVAVFPFLS